MSYRWEGSSKVEEDHAGDPEGRVKGVGSCVSVNFDCVFDEVATVEEATLGVVKGRRKGGAAGVVGGTCDGFVIGVFVTEGSSFVWGDDSLKRGFG